VAVRVNGALARASLRSRATAKAAWPLRHKTAAPLIGNGRGGVWLVLIMAGSLGASLVALSVYPMLTSQQDGRELPVPDELVAA
jgi:hypothetical protein